MSMDRLTKRHKDGYGVLLDFKDTCQAIDRLCDFEDSGLTPERVAELAKAEAEGCKLCNSGRIEITATTHEPDDEYWFSSDPVVGLMYCPLCGRRLTRVEAEAALQAQKGE